MVIYVMNYMLIPIWGYISNRHISTIIIGLQLFIILALRSESLGVDLDAYYFTYSRYLNYSLLDILQSLSFFSNAKIAYGMESGWVLINWIAGNLGMDFHTFLVIHSAVCIFSISYFINKFSKMPWLSFVFIVSIGMYGYMFCILRQTLATAILFFSFPYILQRKFFKYLVVILIASHIHFSACLFLPIYWLSKIALDEKKILIFFIVSSTMFTLAPLLSFVSGSLGKGYRITGDLQYNNLFFFMLMIIISIFFLCKEPIQQSHIKTMLFWSLLMFIPVQILGFIHPIFARASIGVFLPIASVLFPDIFAERKNPDMLHFFSILFFLLFFLYYYQFFLRGTNLEIIPYRFYFE